MNSKITARRANAKLKPEGTPRGQEETKGLTKVGERRVETGTMPHLDGFSLRLATLEIIDNFDISLMPATQRIMQTLHFPIINCDSYVQHVLVQNHLMHADANFHVHACVHV